MIAGRDRYASRVVDVVVQARRRLPEPADVRARRARWIGAVLLVAATICLLIPSRYAASPLLISIPLNLLRARWRPTEDAEDPTVYPWVSSKPAELQQPYDPDLHPPQRPDYDPHQRPGP